MMSKGSFAALSAVFVALATTAIWAGDAAAAGTLDRLRQDKTLRIAYRPDAPPFSYQTGSAEPQGFIVDICRAVAKSLTQQLQLPSLNIVYVPVIQPMLPFRKPLSHKRPMFRFFDRHHEIGAGQVVDRALLREPIGAASANRQLF